MLSRTWTLLGILILLLGIVTTKKFEIRNGKIRNDRAIDDDDVRISQDQNNPPVVVPSANNPRQVDSVTKTPASPRMPLSMSPQCQADVQKYCTRGKNTALPNLKVLQCVDDLDNAVNLISKECQNLIYSFKFNLTHDVRFDEAADRQCSKDLKILDECNQHRDQRGSGRLISCLYENLENITESSCRYFINQLQSVVFADWRLAQYFVDSCMEDIRKFHCGRLDDENESLPHEQGAVVSCLSENYRNVNLKCRQEIHRLAEMQSNDYHLDRALFYACRDDRERLCSQVASGNGRVYRCLYEKKFDTLMTQSCRKEIHRRQMLVVENVKVDAPLIRACRSEMAQHNCQVDQQDGDSRSSLTKLLLCLEDSMKKGFHIIDECRREMLVHRRMLMSDYILSPGIVSDCKTEMIRYCSSLYQQGSNGNSDQRGGRMIHCLLSALSRRAEFNLQCKAAVKGLIRAVDPGNDIRSDPLLERSCRPVIEILCPRVQAGDSNVIMCLLDNLKNPKMTEECEDRLMEVSYFMSRDWRLTPRFSKVCQSNLQTFCNLPKSWSMNDEMTDTQVGIYLSCLYKKKETIDRECRTELKRLMQIRSQSIGLMPEIEENCIDDLSSCAQTEKKGEELKCLQNKYKDLQSQCREAVKTYTQMTMSDPTLDFLLMKACEPMIQLFCSNVESGNENDLIRCLIQHKQEQRMDARCRSGIDHHQITSMKDEAFLSSSFRAHCFQEINDHCTNRKTKAAVVQCLADLVLKDVLKRENFIKEECRSELKFELLQRSESIDFDPILAKSCRKDVENFCKDRTSGNAQIIDCLKENREKLSSVCFDRLKRREKIDVLMPDADFSLVSKCAGAIREYCSNEPKDNLLSCLRRNINSDSTSTTCRRILYHRLMILSSDARFNKQLINNCQIDIQRYCQNELNLLEQNDDDEKDSDEDQENEENDDENQQISANLVDREMGGRVIGCLRNTYADTKITLESSCVSELIDVIQTSKLDVSLDRQLYRACRNFIDEKCTAMDSEDCLKIKLQNGQIPDEDCRNEIKRVIREGKADVHIDRALTFACHADLLKYCNDVPLGNGKQLQCLVGVSKSVTSQCRAVLEQRQSLWETLSDIKGVNDLSRGIQKSSNSFYLITVLLLILCAVFMAGCFCRPFVRYRRVQKYK